MKTERLTALSKTFDAVTPLDKFCGAKKLFRGTRRIYN
jgi:hypothetical protein